MFMTVGNTQGHLFFIFIFLIVPRKFQDADTRKSNIFVYKWLAAVETMSYKSIITICT